MLKGKKKKKLRTKIDRLFLIQNKVERRRRIRSKTALDHPRSFSG